jgi:TatD DNase family protein
VIRLIDTHSHVMDDAFDSDREAVLDRARSGGVARMLLVGFSPKTNRAALDLARQLSWARASVGIHPNVAASVSNEDFDAVAELAGSSEDVVAIGETGLDYFRKRTPHAQQRLALEWHVRLARDLDLPLIVHNRDADADVADILTSGAGSRGVLHCFTSTDPAYLARMLDAGYFVSFAGPLTFRSAEKLRAIAARVPLERLLVETDCPYLAPTPHRGQRNEPAYVAETATCLASIVGLSLEALAERLWANSLDLFPALADASESAA